VEFYETARSVFHFTCALPEFMRKAEPLSLSFWKLSFLPISTWRDIAIPNKLASAGNCRGGHDDDLRTLLRCLFGLFARVLRIIFRNSLKERLLTAKQTGEAKVWGSSSLSDTVVSVSQCEGRALKVAVLVRTRSAAPIEIWHRSAQTFSLPVRVALYQRRAVVGKTQGLFPRVFPRRDEALPSSESTVLPSTKTPPISAAKKAKSRLLSSPGLRQRQPLPH